MKQSIFEEIEFCLPVTIPEGFNSSISEGDKVKRGAVLATREETKREKIDAASKLKIDSKRVAKELVVRVTKGDRCIKGAVLAEKSGYWSTVKLTCPYDAVVVDVSDSVIEIEEYEGVKEVTAAIGGKVKDLAGSQLNIATDALQYELGYGAGNAVWGELAICYGRGEGSDWMNSELLDKVIVIEELTPVMWHKANALGVKGVIANSAPTTFEQWVDNKRDGAGLLINDGDQSKWERLVEELEDYQGNMVFLVPQEKLLVIQRTG